MDPVTDMANSEGCGKDLQDQDAKIQEFVVVFQRLRSDLDTGMLHQTVTDTSKILDNTNLLGTHVSLLLMLLDLIEDPSSRTFTQTRSNGYVIPSSMSAS